MPPSIDAGSVLASRYELRALLGRGGMGRVYRAFDRTLGEVVAVKALLPGADVSPEVLKRFREEVKIARRVRHRNVCAIHSYEEDGDVPFIVMELVEGVDLKRFLQKVGAMEWDDGLDVALQVAEGLAAIHEAGVVHRDLKPANITRDDRGVVRVMDFGIAKGGTHAGFTDDGKVVCTIDYVSPEQLMNQDVDPRSDLYSFGIVLYELFTGRVPFRGDTPAATMRKHLEEQPPLHGVAADLIPRALIPVLERALAKDRRNRFPDARAMRDALQRAKEEVRQRSTDAVDPTPPPVVRRRAAPYPKEARLLVPTLVRALRNADPSVRIGAADALKRTPDAAARDGLTAALQDPDLQVRAHVAEALAMLSHRPEMAAAGGIAPPPPLEGPPPSAPVRAGPREIGTSSAAEALAPTSDLNVDAHRVEEPRPRVTAPSPAPPVRAPSPLPRSPAPTPVRPGWLPWLLGVAVVAGVLIYVLLQRGAPQTALPTPPPRPGPTLAIAPTPLVTPPPETPVPASAPTPSLPPPTARPSVPPPKTRPAPTAVATVTTTTMPAPTPTPEPPSTTVATAPPPTPTPAPTPPPTPAPPLPGALVEISDPALVRPTCASCPAPQVPLIALSPQYEPIWRNTGGRVELQVLVDETGRVVDVKPTQGDRALADAAAKAVRRWKYSPPLKQGVAVKVWLTVPVQFTVPR